MTFRRVSEYGLRDKIRALNTSTFHKTFIDIIDELGPHSIKKGA